MRKNGTKRFLKLCPTISFDWIRSAVIFAITNSGNSHLELWTRCHYHWNFTQRSTSTKSFDLEFLLIFALLSFTRQSKRKMSFFKREHRRSRFYISVLFILIVLKCPLSFLVLFWTKCPTKLSFFVFFPEFVYLYSCHLWILELFPTQN